MNALRQPMTMFWTAWLAAVVFIFPLPGTIALRNLLLLVGLVAVLATRRAVPALRPPAELRPAAWALVAITAWLVLHTAALAPAPATALGNLRGDWLVPILVGALATWSASRVTRPIAISSVTAALYAHVIWVFGWQFWIWIGNGASVSWPVLLVPFGQNDYQSSINGMLLTLVLAERVASKLAHGHESPYPPRMGWIMVATSLLGDVVIRMRNGTLSSIVMLGLAVLAVGRIRRRYLALLLVAAGLGISSFALDERWSGLRESLVIGWTSESLYWQGFDEQRRPRLASGAPVEQSAYARSAWARQALDAIAEHPLGLGFGRDAFGRAIEMKYGYKGMVSSHSGWLDFTLAAGVPGIVLLLLTAGLAIRGGWLQFRRHDDPAGLMLAFLVGGYLLRCLLDGHMSGWRLGLFAFICGVLIAAMRRPDSAA